MKVVCPICFSKIDVSSDIGYRCKNSRCNPAKGKTDYFRKSIPFLEMLGLKDQPWSIPHTWDEGACGEEACDRVCNKCKQEIPPDTFRLSSPKIAIIGSKESGKSHYIATLVEWIKHAAGEFGWSFNWADDESANSFMNDFYKPLYEEKVPIISTRAVTNGMAKPLSAYLTFGVGKFQKVIMLVFFDAAGENLEGDTTQISRYICNASGIICLLDPLQLPSIRKSIIAEGRTENTLPEKNGITGDVIGKVARLIRKNNRLGTARIKIPLAVALSKMDYIRDVLNDSRKYPDEVMISNALFNNDSHHNGCFDETKFGELHELMRRWVDKVDESEDIDRNLVSAFKSSGYFGFSALGCNPRGNLDDNGNDVLQHEPQPCRVEDPFLWILWKLGLIRSRKD